MSASVCSDCKRLFRHAELGYYTVDGRGEPRFVSVRALVGCDGTGSVNCLRSQLATLKAERERIAVAAKEVEGARFSSRPMDFENAVEALLAVARRKGQ